MKGPRGDWNERQKTLREMLESDIVPPEAIELFIRQHAALHTGLQADAEPGDENFAEEILQGLDEEQLRRVPPKGEHSIVWIWWHLARIEDVTMNMLVAGVPQLAYEEDWFKRLGTPRRDCGNNMDVPAVQQLSAEMDVQTLLAYRTAVGQRTEEIVRGIALTDLHQPVDPARLQALLHFGALKLEDHDIADYWGNRDTAGLLLMPPTRHCFLHLNEAERIKKKVGR